MTKVAQARREFLFRKGKPTIRPAVYEDIKWLWAAAKRGGFEGGPEEFTAKAEPYLAQADRVFMLEDQNCEFNIGRGPVGIFLCNYDGWALCPHVEWFPWTTPRNRIRGTVGFLQAMRYSREIGVIKIQSSEQYDKWFKWLKRYVAINLAGRIPHGRTDGTESIFYVRGRKQHEFHTRRQSRTKRRDTEPAPSHKTRIYDRSGEQVSH